MPNDPYSNFVGMQQYMNANPDAMNTNQTAAGHKDAAEFRQPGYEALGGNSWERYEHSENGYTPGMSALDNSLMGGEHPGAGVATEPKQKPSKQQGDPGDPDYTPDTRPGHKGKPPKNTPPGKPGNDDGGKPTTPFVNSSPFNPMIAQLQMMMPQPQAEETESGPKDKKKKAEEH